MKTLSKAILAAACLCLAAADAWAISRYDPTRMSCDRVRATVAREGAIILRYRAPRNPTMTLYDRYVSDARFCVMEDVRVRAYVPSADMKSCPVYRCESPDIMRDHHRRIYPRMHRR